jgi:hypothetical protein
MGYDSFIRVGTENKKEIPPTIITALKEKYQGLKESDDGFLWVGQTMHTGARGFGTGPTDDFTSQLATLFEDYPYISFLIYFTYWDNSILEVYRCYQGQVKLMKTINLDGFILSGVKLYANIQGIDIDHEITEEFI